MEQPFGQLHAAHLTAGFEPFALQDLACAVQHQQANTALQHHKTLKTGPGLFAPMTMGAHIGARLQHVEEALHQITFLVQVVVFASPWAGCSALSHLREQALRDSSYGLRGHGMAGKVAPLSKSLKPSGAALGGARSADYVFNASPSIQ